ncbi:hypothetical protein HMPREF3189_00170 [Clostridiales bacterium KA00134]|nr:hypothetical protein HMPREF3189_00170 [Clostridiales bacterium KA00134]
MKRIMSFFLAILMILLSFGDAAYALGSDIKTQEKLKSQEEIRMNEQGLENSAPIGRDLFSDSILEVHRQGFNKESGEIISNYFQPMTLTYQDRNAGETFRAWVENSSKTVMKGDVNSPNRGDTYDIVFPVMNLKTSNTKEKIYSLTIVNSDIIKTVNYTEQSPYMTKNIVDVDQGEIVGKIEVIKDNTGSIKVNYIFDKTDVVTYTTSPLNLKLETKENATAPYILLPNSPNEARINFYGFTIKGPIVSQDNKSATITIDEKEGYQKGNITLSGLPNNVTSTNDGSKYIFTLSDGETYASFNATFKNEAQTSKVPIVLDARTPQPKTYAAKMTSTFTNEADKLIATVTLKKDAQIGAPELPDKIAITSFSISRKTSGAIKGEPLELKGDDFKPDNTGSLIYKLVDGKKLNVDGKSTDDGKTKTYKLEIPVKKWMTFKNDYKSLIANWKIEYKYSNDVNQYPSGEISFGEEKISLQHKAIVAPSAATGENFLYEKVEIRPNNDNTLPDGFKIKVSKREVTFPANVASDNKFELLGPGVEKKVPWTGYNLNPDLEFTYEANNPDSSIRKIEEKGEDGQATGKFHYEIVWSTRVTKLPNNYKPYINDWARSNLGISFEYQGLPVSDHKSTGISFVQIVDKPSEKVQIAQRTEEGKRITTWAIVFNRDHKNKAVVEIEDTIKHGFLRKDSLKYYFIDPETDIRLNAQAINNLLNGRAGNSVGTDPQEAKPYYTLTKNDGENQFSVKFGDHSDILKNKIEEIISKHKKFTYENENKRKKATNIEIIKYFFPDYNYKKAPKDTKILSKGEYFKKTNQIEGKARNFPDLSIFTNEEIEHSLKFPFTTLVNPEKAENPYFTLIKAKESTKTDRGYYKTLHDNNTKTDALILTYETESETKPEVNKFKSIMLRNISDLYIYEPRKDDGDNGYPRFHLEGRTGDDEIGEETGKNEQKNLYPIYKHSYIDDDMTLIKNGVLANLKGSYCEEIEIEDRAYMNGGKLDKYTGLRLVKFPLSDFEENIKALKQKSPQKADENAVVYENRIYDDFIKKHISGDAKFQGESVPFKSSNENKIIKFKTGVTEKSYTENKEANQFVYLFTYNMDASYKFIKSGTSTIKATIVNTATVKYDKDLKVEAQSNIDKNDFLTKEDITQKGEPETSGKKTYRLSFDFTNYELKNVKEIKIKDEFMYYDDFVKIKSHELRGPLKQKISLTDPDSYKEDPTDITLTMEGKEFTIKSKTDLSGKKFTIIYNVEMDLSKIYAGSDYSLGKKIENTATAILKGKNDSSQTIEEKASAYTDVKYGEFFKKSVDKWKDGATPEEINNFKESSIRHYTLTFDLENKDFLKKSDNLIIKDTFESCHTCATYKNISLKFDGNQDALKVKKISSGNKEVVFKVTKNGINEFPDKFSLEYDVILKNGEIAGASEKEVTNKASAIFESKTASYMQTDTAKTPVKSGAMEVKIGRFTLNINKILPDIIKSKSGKTKDKDYSEISFTLSGKYKAKNKDGTETEKYYNEDNITVSSNGSLIFDGIPFNGNYTLKENVKDDSSYQALKDKIVFKVSDKGDSIIFEPACFGKGQVEVTRVNNDTSPEVKTIEEAGTSKNIVEVTEYDKWKFVVQIYIDIYNKIKPIKEHTLIFRKVDQGGNPLKGAKFTIKRENEEIANCESDKNGIVKFDKLQNGKYKVLETDFAQGRYKKKASFEIELTENMAAEYDYGDVINQKLTLHNISFKKADAVKDENGQIIPLQGAEFELMKKGSRDEFSVFKTAKSGHDGIVTFYDVPGGIYKIVETKAPIGYGLPKDTTVISDFVVEEDKDENYYNWSYKHKIIQDIPNADNQLIEQIDEKIVTNSKIKHSISFTKYMEVYNGAPKPMTGATFILKSGNDKVKISTSDENGLVKFENLDNKQYQIVEAEPKKDKINDFKEHEVNTDIIKVPDLTNSRDMAQDIKLFTAQDKLNKDKQFINYKIRKGFSFRKYDEALDENGQAKVMTDVTFKAYRKAGNDFEKDVYKCLRGNPARQDFKEAISKSDENGDVKFEGFEPGTYKIVETRVPGYENLSFEVVVSKDGVKFPKYIEENSVEKIKENLEASSEEKPKKEKIYIVKNSYTRHEVVFKKIDKFTGGGIEGAVFKVEKLEKDGKYTLINDKIVSNSQGLVSIPGLLNGQYRITEIKAPNGYKQSDVSFTFTLSDSDLYQVTMKDIENESIGGGMFILPAEGLLNKKDHAAYMYGYPDGSFRPRKSMTRAEVTAMFGRLLLKRYIKSREFKSIYSDVKKGSWYGSAITIMTDLKLVEGYPNGLFNPNAPITRAEFATIASRFDKLYGGRVDFKDLNTSHWAYSYIASAYNKGWVKGYPDGSFRPESYIRREEVVAITNRMLDRKCDLDFVRLHKKELKMFYDNLEKSWSYGDIIESTNGHDYHRKKDSLIDEIWERLNGKEFHI